MTELHNNSPVTAMPDTNIREHLKEEMAFI